MNIEYAGILIIMGILFLRYIFPKYVRFLGKHFGEGIFDHINESMDKMIKQPKEI